MLSAPQRQRSLELVQQLMEIAGPSGHEQEVARFIRRHLAAAGVSPEQMVHDSAHRRCPVAESETGNLIVKLPGTHPAPRRLLMAHMDTVPICVGARPLVQDDVIVPQGPNTGLGADDRAGVAVVLFTALELLQNGLPHAPLTLLFTVQEEIGLQGARHLDPGLLDQPALAFNWDGGDPAKLTIGAIGGYRMTIDIRGKASHAGVAPEKGVSAVTAAGLAIARLHEAGLLGKIEQGSLQGTSNIGVIQGGTATNVVTDHVRLTAEVRSHQVETIDALVDHFQQAFTHAAQQVRSSDGDKASIEFEGDLNYQPFQMPIDSPSVQEAERVLTRLQLAPVHAVANGGLDANWMFRHGIPTVSLGCGQRNQHTTNEQLDIGQFHTACEIALRLAGGRQETS